MTDNTTSYAPPSTDTDAIPVVDDVETPDIPDNPTPPPDFRLLSFWDWVRVRFLGQDVLAEYQQRLANLNQAIAQYPDAAANYLQRAEFYMQMHDYPAAAEDFQRALELAAADYEASAWGILAQSVRDRALAGLAKAAARL